MTVHYAIKRYGEAWWWSACSIHCHHGVRYAASSDIRMVTCGSCLRSRYVLDHIEELLAMAGHGRVVSLIGQDRR